MDYPPVSDDVVWLECEKCEILYTTAGGWEDELFCFTCYHDQYPCPSWCPENECPGCVNCTEECDVWAGTHLWTELHDGKGTNWKQCEFCREKRFHE